VRDTSTPLLLGWIATSDVDATIYDWLELVEQNEELATER
jgi:hypothetical protein